MSTPLGPSCLGCPSAVDRRPIRPLPHAPATASTMRRPCQRRPAPIRFAAVVLGMIVSASNVGGAPPPSSAFVSTTTTFGVRRSSSRPTSGSPPSAPLLFMSSYDMSDYSSSSSDYEDDSSDSDKSDADKYGDPAYKAFDAPDDEDVKLHGPVPLSKNAGNRYVALVFDKALDANGRDWEEMKDNRTELTHDHVHHCRRTNLYNDTFNGDSDVDVLHSYQVLSSCMSRPIGHILVLESPTLSSIKSFVASDPVVQTLGCNVDDVPLYRWRHIKDHTLRIDDGRYGWPNVLIQLDRSAEELAGLGCGDLRERVEKDKLEYLIKSERVIAAGPLHLPTEFKDDPSSVPVGDIVFFNSYNRTESIDFAENDPAAAAGLYDSMRVHKYNSLDVTGKFVSENIMDDKSGWFNKNLRMKEEMREEGFPVEDEQTPWLNW